MNRGKTAKTYNFRTNLNTKLISLNLKKFVWKIYLHRFIIGIKGDWHITTIGWIKKKKKNPHTGEQTSVETVITNLYEDNIRFHTQIVLISIRWDGRKKTLWKRKTHEQKLYPFRMENKSSKK